jgi:hypothetical protein
VLLRFVILFLRGIDDAEGIEHGKGSRCLQASILQQIKGFITQAAFCEQHCKLRLGLRLTANEFSKLSRKLPRFLRPVQTYQRSQ